MHGHGVISTDYVLYLLLPHLVMSRHTSSYPVLQFIMLQQCMPLLISICIIGYYMLFLPTSPYSSTLEANHLQTARSSLQGLSLDCCLPTPRASMMSTELHLMCWINGC